MNHFVLMADIQKSRNKDNHALIRQFRELVDTINQSNAERILSPLTITLGDEFQGIVRSIADGIHLLLMLEETIISKKIDFRLRYVLNYGVIDTEINSQIAYGMLGSGLTDARELLTSIKKTDSRFVVRTNDHKLDKQLNDALFVYQSFTDEWKQKDLPIVSAFLAGKTYQEVAEIIGIDPSSAWRREKTLKIKPYFTMKSVILGLI